MEKKHTLQSYASEIARDEHRPYMTVGRAFEERHLSPMDVILWRGTLYKVSLIFNSGIHAFDSRGKFVSLYNDAVIERIATGAQTALLTMLYLEENECLK